MIGFDIEETQLRKALIILSIGVRLGQDRPIILKKIPKVFSSQFYGTKHANP